MKISNPKRKDQRETYTQDTYCLLLYYAAFSQNSVSLALGTDYYTGQSNYKNASGLSIGYMHHMGSHSEWGVAFNYSTWSSNVSSPTTTSAVSLSASDLYLVYGYKFSNMIFDIDLKPVIGAGFKVINREAFQIDLGALGKERIPELSKSYFASFIGLLFSKNVTNNLSFFIEPGVSVYDATKMHNIFSIKGGIGVTIN